ncbi:MAG TPA: CHRD domain-containing protein [Povalibacter sp.]|nr:CHRD domain-containing protein [Povalibacter sp.]
MKVHLTPIVLGAVLVALAAGTTVAHDKKKREEVVSARLVSINEVPALSTPASGRFKAVIDEDEGTITYTISYDALEGAVTQSHIHFGQKGVNGGVSVFFCTNLGNGPAGTPACPPPPAEISGTITAANVIGPAGQGIAAGEFAELLRAIREGVAYANVHSDRFPAGEIRGQIREND